MTRATYRLEARTEAFKENQGILQRSLHRKTSGEVPPKKINPLRLPGETTWESQRFLIKYRRVPTICSVGGKRTPWTGGNCKKALGSGETSKTRETGICNLFKKVLEGDVTWSRPKPTYGDGGTA